MKKKAKVYQGDEALEKILAARPKPPENTELKEQLLNMRRHLKGSLITVERFLGFYQPKCKVCYDNYGFIDKCVCEKKD